MGRAIRRAFRASRLPGQPLLVAIAMILTASAVQAAETDYTWLFNGSTNGWTASSGTSVNSVGGSLHVVFATGGGIYTPVINYIPGQDIYHRDYIRFGYQIVSGTVGRLQFNFSTDTRPNFSSTNRDLSGLIRDGGWHYVTFRLDDIGDWLGSNRITQMRFVAIGSGGGGASGTMNFDFMALREDDKLPQTYSCPRGTDIVSISPAGWTNGSIAVTVRGNDPGPYLFPECGPTPPDQYGSGVAVFRYAVNGNWSGVDYTDQDGQWPTGWSQTTIVVPPGSMRAGANAFLVHANDRVGFQATSSTAATLYYDGTGPRVSFSQPAAGNYRTDEGIGFSIADDHSGVSGFCAQWDNATPPASACVGQASGSTRISAAGGYYAWHTLYVHAYDAAGNITTASSGPWMFSPNRAPSASCPGAQRVNEASSLAFTVTGSDPDGDPVTLSASSMPTGATFDGATFRWTPSYTQAGDYQPCFTASDPSVTGSTCCVAIHVENVNRPPVISCPESQTGSEGALLTFTVTASDPDADAVTLAGQDLPQGATFEGGVFRWTPTSSQAGDYLPHFTASDYQLSTSCDVPVHVTDVPAPVVQVVYPNGSETLMAGTTETLRWTATGSLPVTGVDLYLSRNGPAGTFASLATGIANSGAYDWTVTGPASSNCYLKVVAHDANGNPGEDRSDMAFAIAVVRDEIVWCAEQRITYDPLRSEAPDLAVTTAGVHVVWQEAPENGTSWDVRYTKGTAHWPADTLTWQPPMTLSSSPSSHSPSILGDSWDRLHVAWAHEGEPLNEPLFYRRWDVVWHAPEGWRPGQSTVRDPSFTVDRNGVPHMVWSEDLAGQGTIYHTRWFSLPPSGWMQEEIVSQGASRLHPDLAGDSQSRLHAVWLGNDGGVPGIYYKSWENAWGAEVQVNSAPVDSASPKVAVDGLGRVHVVWADTRSGHSEVYCRSGDGTTWDPEFAVSPLDESNSVAPEVGVDGTGRVHVVWSDTRDGNAEIYHRIWDGAWLPVERVTNAAGNSSAPRIVCASDYIYLAWTDDRDGNPEIYWRKGTVCPNGICQDLPTPALASLVDSRVEGGRVFLRWYVSGSESGRAAVYRTGPDVDWTRLGEQSPDGSGYVVFEDDGVTAGRRYGYRLGLPTAQGEVIAGETWVEVPALGFALQGVRPNPVEGGVLSVHFTLPSAIPASLALYDVSGRQVQKLDVGALGAGVHVVELRPQANLAAGVYLLRLAQGSRVETQRVALVR